MRCYAVILASLLAACAPLEGAMLRTTVVVPIGQPGIPVVIQDEGDDNQVYEVHLGSIAVAKAQSDYGVLRNYVYSNIGEFTIARASIATTLFNDRLFVDSPIDGIFIVDLLVEGEITFTQTNPIGGNQQTFYSQWTIRNLTVGPSSECFHLGTYVNMPALPIHCSMTVPVSAGLNTVFIVGQLQTHTLGRYNVGEMDLFNTSRMVGLGVFDGGSLVNAAITSESGTIYPASAVPEPATVTLYALAAVGLLIRRKLAPNCF